MPADARNVLLQKLVVTPHGKIALICVVVGVAMVSADYLFGTVAAGFFRECCL